MDIKEQLQNSEALKRCNYLVNQLYQERSKYVPVWKQLSDYIYPMRGRFDEEEGSREGSRRDRCLIDPFPMDAVNKCSAGLHGGLTSPSKPWFALTLRDKEKADNHAVRMWLDDVHDIMMSVYAKSNTYNMLYQLYAELPQFGTAAAMMYQDFETGIYHKSFTCGEYAGGVDSKGRVNMFARRMAFNAIQMVQEFGKENVSQEVRNAYTRGDVTTRFRVNMLIERNDDYNPEVLKLGNFPWKSWYWEEGESDRFLRVSGYHEQPFLMPRWTVVANEVYGVGPGHNALGNCMQLQKLEKNKLHCTDNEADPAMMFPASMDRVDTRPGAKNYVPDGTQMTAYPLVPPGAKRYEGMVMLVNEKRNQISANFYNDLMTMLAVQDNPQMTAREVAAREEEKLLMLSPVLEQFHNEVLDPLTKRTFGICLRNGLFPPMPEEISGEELKVEFISLLAQAQRMVEMPSIEKVMGFAGSMAAINPEIIDNINFDEALRRSADIYGAPEQILRSEEETAEIRAKRQEAQQAQMEAEQMAQMAAPARDMAQAARLMSETSTGGSNALEEMLGGIV